MLNAGIFPLGVFADEDSVNVVVGGFVAGNGFARANVGEEIKGAAEG